MRVHRCRACVSSVVCFGRPYRRRAPGALEPCPARSCGPRDVHLGIERETREVRRAGRDPPCARRATGAVARGSDVTFDMLGVLALDGGSASIDALLPHLDPALVLSLL